MKLYRPGDALRGTFSTRNAAGEGQAADAPPAAALNRNGTDDGTVTVTVTQIAGGRYRYSLTIPSDYAAGDDLAVCVTAAVDGVTDEADVVAVRLVAVDVTDAARFGLTALPATGTLAVNPTIAATQVFNNTGQTTNVPADLQTIKTQTVTAAAGVTFPGSIGTSTFAAGGNVNVTTWAGTTVESTGQPGYPIIVLAAESRDAVRDAVLDRELAGNHDAAGTPGKLLQSLPSSGAVSIYAGGAVASVTGDVGGAIRGQDVNLPVRVEDYAPSNSPTSALASYAPAKAGDEMALTSDYNAAKTAPLDATATQNAAAAALDARNLSALNVAALLTDAGDAADAAGSAASEAAAANAKLPADFVARGATLPLTGTVNTTTPPTAAAVADATAAKVLADPAKKLVTDADGKVTTSNPATVINVSVGE